MRIYKESHQYHNYDKTPSIEAKRILVECHGKYYILSEQSIGDESLFILCENECSDLLITHKAGSTLSVKEIPGL